MPIIEVEHVSKVYPARRGTRILLGRGGLNDWLSGRGRTGAPVLQDISFTVETGEALGIIGRNGSGKSTLLKILAGVTLPTAGTVTVRGRVASLLELGAGFHPMLTGRENIYLNAGLLGMRHAQVDQVFDEIVAFSGIGEFIEQPVDTYSSGMYVRIAFAVAVHTNPDIFLVDEVLSVGDEEFQRRCRIKIGELREQGKTIVFVSHDLGIVNTLCDRVLLLDRGRPVARPTPRETIEFYLRQIGRETGLHTMSSGRIDTVFNHGQISLFRDQREVTAPQGISLQFMSLGQHMGAHTADWSILERSDNHCVARGVMPRLPVALRIELRIADDAVLLSMAIEFLRDTTIEELTLALHLPLHYQQYLLGDEADRFPEPHPRDLEWQPVTAAPPGDTEILVTSTHEDAAPVLMSISARVPDVALFLYNTGYIQAARVLHLRARDPGMRSGPGAGRVSIADVRITLGLSREAAASQLESHSGQRTLRAGALTAKLGRGHVRLGRGDEVLTTAVHLHTQIRTGRLWTMSHGLSWNSPRLHQGRIRLSAESPRLPFRQHWELEALPQGIAFRVFFSADRPFKIEEYNISLTLDPRFTRWETDIECAEFPDIPPEQRGWRHLNQSYQASNMIGACGDGLPWIRLRTAVHSPLFIMSAINTGYGQNARVLQAICTPERSGMLEFGPGRHPVFDGVIRLEAAET